MTTYKYQFETNWQFEAPIEAVWALVGGFKYSEWWPGVSSERVYKSGGRDGIGDKYRYVFRTKLPYRLEFVAEIVHIEAPHRLEIVAHGELEGRGSWTLRQEGRIAHVRYVWQVNTKKIWMDVLAPILRPAFVWNHDQVMDAGARGIADKLGIRLAAGK